MRASLSLLAPSSSPRLRALQVSHDHVPLLSETCPSDAVSGRSAGSDEAAEEDPEVVLDDAVDDESDNSPSSLTSTGFAFLSLLLVVGPSYVLKA